MENKDIQHLRWIYDRLIYKHKENMYYDYMEKFKEIIDSISVDEIKNELPQTLHYSYYHNTKVMDNGNEWCYDCGKYV